MLDQINNFFTIEVIYLWLNIGVIPFWMCLIIFPSSSISRYFIKSIFPFLILSGVYSYLLYTIFKLDYDFLGNFNLYLSFDNLLFLFSSKYFLIMFWCHFLAINLFCGAWITYDSLKQGIPKFLTLFPLLITYFIGHLGIFLYWLIRIFFAKRISLYD